MSTSTGSTRSLTIFPRVVPPIEYIVHPIAAV